MTSSRVLRLCVVAASLFLSSAATAQQDNADREAEAESYFRLGLQAQKRGALEEALIHFRDSYTVDPRQPGPLRNLALTEAQLPGHYLDALKHLRLWLRSPAASAPDVRTRMEGVLRDVMAETGHIDVSHTGGQLTIDGIDAASLEHEGNVYDVEPGPHVVALAAGGGTQTQSITVTNGVPVKVAFAEPRTAPTTPRAPLPSTEIAPPPSSDHAPDHPFWTGTRMVAATVSGLAIVSFAVAAGFGVDESSKRSDWTNLTALTTSSTCWSGSGTACASIQSALSSERNDAHWANGMFITAGVLSAGAIALWLWPSSKEGPSSANLRVVPALTSGTTGILAVGSF